MKGLRWWRRARGLTQAELSEASDVERSHLAKIERGEVEEPRPDTLRRLAEALGVEVLDLLYGELSVGIFGAPEGLVRESAHHRNITATSPWEGHGAHETPTSRPPETTGRPSR